jgi:hypothetical protein
MSESAPRLPALQQTVLDAATLDALFRDLATCTQILAVIPKGSAQGYANEKAITLADARVGLDAGSFRGVQVRYRYDDKEWCDTLLATPAGVRLVRICTDDISGTLTP